MTKAPFLMRIYASGLGIQPSRRDELYSAARLVVAAYSEHRDRERAAGGVAALGGTVEEFRFLARVIDNVPKRDFGSPYSARATLSQWLSQRAVQIAAERKSP